MQQGYITQLNEWRIFFFFFVTQSIDKYMCKYFFTLNHWTKLSNTKMHINEQKFYRTLIHSICNHWSLNVVDRNYDQIKLFIHVQMRQHERIKY